MPSHGAPYEVNIVATDDETYEFSVELAMADGTSFPFADYAIEYALSLHGAQQFLLTQDDGVTIVESTGTVTFQKLAAQLFPNRTYEHGCRLVHRDSGRTIALFDGEVSISEGNF